MLIRSMTLEDIDQVAAIEAASFSMPWSRDSFEASILQDNYHLLVVTDDDNTEIWAYSAYIGVIDEAEIPNVCVREDKRKNHIAEAMLKSLIADAGANGIRQMFLEVRESNNPAIGLYTKLGFKPISVRKNFYEKPVENAIVMQLILE